MRERRQILAAGGIVHRMETVDGRSLRQIAVIHRPRYDDWTLPKGKLDPGECLPETAVREISEETGVGVRLEAPLDRLRYDTSKGAKQVDWWSARALWQKERKPDHEVDEVVWLTLPEARAKVTYSDDRDLLDQFRELPPTTTLMIVRHAHAMERKHWSGRDAARPLTGKGRQQSVDIVPLLASYGIEQLVSSSSNRCVSTLLPFATRRRLTIDRRTQLSEEEGTDDPDGVAALMGQLRMQVARSGEPLAVCGHRPVLPHMLDALDLPDWSLRKGECVPVHLTADGEVFAVERHRPQKKTPA